jgi:aryl-alcohol dehydrogenase-like predicted oxidoreductase
MKLKKQKFGRTDYRVSELCLSTSNFSRYASRRPTSASELLNLDRDWKSQRFGSDVGDAVLQVLSEIADKHLATPAQIALAWVLRNPQVTSAAISAPDARELRELIRAADTILTPEETGALARLPPCGCRM